MSILLWLLAPITAHAILSPVPPQPQKVPLLGEESSYSIDYPVEGHNALQSSGIAEASDIPPISTTTLISQYLPPEMMPVLNCESHFRQWDENGHILTSSTDDIGIAQINVKTWAKKAKELGYDIYTTEGNLQMARYILNNAGIKSWSCYNLIVNK